MHQLKHNSKLITVFSYY